MTDPYILYPMLAIVGFTAGVLSGTLGVGSGLLIIPALVFLFGMPQKSAQGISLMVMVPMTLIGAVCYKMNPEIKVETLKAVVMIIGAVAGVLLGTGIAAKLPTETLKKIFALFLIVVAFKMLTGKPEEKRPFENDNHKLKIEGERQNEGN